ncbi:glycoside hydrolase family 32 protein [Paenibacillus tarimensis]
MKQTQFKEPFRPQYHFSPPANWMNDPNGMVYFQGEYHLFYQYHPDGTTWGPMYWGHAVSTDLVHWEHLPVALYPDHNGYIFSGSVVVDWHDTSGFFGGNAGLVAVFTHSEPIPNTVNLYKQRQSLAYSSDSGRSWTMYEGNPVLSDDKQVDFRDPKVFWHRGLKQWVMVLAAGDHCRFYASPDLKEWEFTGEFGKHEGSHDGVWECPDLFELPVDGDQERKKWVLIVSIGDHQDHEEGSRTQYFIGEFDGRTFHSENPADAVLWLDHGRDNYAGVTWSDVPERDGRRIFIGWMSNWKYANYTPTSTWRSAMTIPRVLTLREEAEGSRLFQAPAAELKSLRETLLSRSNLWVETGENPLNNIRGKSLEIIAEIEPDDAARFGFRIHGSKQGEDGTVISYDCFNRRLMLDRRRSGVVDFHEQFGCLHGERLEPVNGRLKLHLFIDWCSVELFANDGKLVITDLIFPLSDCDRLEWCVTGGRIKLHSLEVYGLRTIYAGPAASPVCLASGVEEE